MRGFCLLGVIATAYPPMWAFVVVGIVATIVQRTLADRRARAFVIADE